MIRNQFRHRVDAQRFVSTDAGGGSTTKRYVVCHENIPCLIVHKSGKESLTIGKKTHWISHSIFLRTLKNPALDEIDRFMHTHADGTYHHLEIIWVKREREQAGILRADCVEKEVGNPDIERAAAAGDAAAAPVPALQVSASANPNSGDKPLSVQFTGGASGGVPPYTCDWDFDDGSPHSDLQNPQHEYTQEGNYNAKLTITDSAVPSNIDDETVPIEVTIAPTELIEDFETGWIIWNDFGSPIFAEVFDLADWLSWIDFGDPIFIENFDIINWLLWLNFGDPIFIENFENGGW